MIAPRVLAAALWALTLLYAAWFHDDHHPIAALLVFALPALLLALTAPRHARARFWAGVLALVWFSHGVMSAWSHPRTRSFALLELALALLVIGASSWPGLHARLRRRAKSEHQP